MTAPRYREAGQLRTGYTAAHTASWRAVLACGTCGSFVLAASSDDEVQWTAIHNRWHEQSDGARRTPGPRMPLGWPDGH